MEEEMNSSNEEDVTNNNIITVLLLDNSETVKHHKSAQPQRVLTILILHTSEGQSSKLWDFKRKFLRSRDKTSPPVKTESKQICHQGEQCSLNTKIKMN